MLTSWSDIADGNHFVSNIVIAFNGYLVEEEYGFTNDADAWTGSTGQGEYYSDQTCSDWTDEGSYGVTTEADAFGLFYEETFKTCSTVYTVQCVRVED